MTSRIVAAPLERYYITQVVAIAGRTFGRGLRPGTIEAHARAAVAELIESGGGVTAFLPELALRAVRDAVEREVAT